MQLFFKICPSTAYIFLIFIWLLTLINSRLMTAARHRWWCSTLMWSNQCSVFFLLDQIQWVDTQRWRSWVLTSNVHYCHRDALTFLTLRSSCCRKKEQSLMWRKSDEAEGIWNNTNTTQTNVDLKEEEFAVSMSSEVSFSLPVFGNIGFRPSPCLWNAINQWISSQPEVILIKERLSRVMRRSLVNH